MKISFFDLETQYLFQEVGGRSNISKCKLAVAGTRFDGQHKLFEESIVNDLFEELNRADLIIGHNLMRFDYLVLEPYLGKEKIEILKSKTFDIMLYLWDALGYPPKLDDLGRLNLGMTKTIDTMKIPGMWRDGKHQEVMEYLLNDLKITEAIFNLGRNLKKLKVGAGYEVPVDW